MNVETLRALVGADPFRPFALRMKDARVIRVQHRNFVTLSSDGKSFTIFGGGPTGTIETILIANCELDEPKPAG